MNGQVGTQTSIKRVNFDLPLYSVISENKSLHITKPWMTVEEPIGIWSENKFTVPGILEHLNVTKDHSDYLWHLTRYRLYYWTVPTV